MRLIDNHLRRALDYVRPYWGALVPVVLVSILSTGLSLVLPYLSKVLVDDAILGRDLTLLFQIVGLVIVIPLVSFGLNVFSGMRYTGVSADILFDMRLDLYRHLQRLSPRYYARTPLGDIVTRINGDIGEIQRVVSEAALSWFGQVIALIGTVGMLIYLDWQLFVASLVVMPPSLYTLVRYRSELETRITKLREKSSQIGSFLIETLQGMRTVVGANAQGREIERFRNRNDAFVEALLSMRLYTYVAGGLPGLLLTAGTALIFLLGGYRVIDGTMSLGTLVAFMAYQARLMAPVQGLMGIYTNIATARASLVRVHEVLDERPDVSQVSEPKLMETCRGEIQLQGISFDFGRGVGGLSQVDIKIPAGQIVAIVGESGCGKSTLADLLERHFDPQEGQVLLDGVPMSTLLLKDVRRHVSVVPQDPFIFHASFIDNVRYADPKATDDKVRAAVDAAG
ncbi:MAG TPA: ABC transporter, partial [Gemmatimonadetes bacterium]|nr:ABC transporter [Gemmatimonadota bacterium]